MLDRLILNMANSTWAPRPQPDGRVAVYYFPRRAFVLLDEADYRELQRRNRTLIIVYMVLLAPCFFLWLTWFKGHARLEIAVIVTLLVIPASIVLERWIKRPSLDALMRAPVSPEAAPALTWSNINGAGLAAMDDQYVRKSIRYLYAGLFLPPLLSMLSIGGIGAPPVKTHLVVIYLISWPVMLFALIRLRRERARRAANVAASGDASVS